MSSHCLVHISALLAIALAARHATLDSLGSGCLKPPHLDSAEVLHKKKWRKRATQEGIDPSSIETLFSARALLGHVTTTPTRLMEDARDKGGFLHMPSFSLLPDAVASLFRPEVLFLFNASQCTVYGISQNQDRWYTSWSDYPKNW